MGTPVAGPGPYSERTDRQPVREMPATEYGERQETTAIQGAAPMAASPMNPEVAGAGAAAARVPGMGGPSGDARPVTDGADVGPGQGREALSSSRPAQSNENAAMMTVFEFMANRPGRSDSARNLVRKMKGQI